jgi:hypothetical protein
VSGPRDPLELARAELLELRRADDWNEPTPVELHFHPPPAARRSSPPPLPLPSSAPAHAHIAARFVQRVPAWGLVVLGIVGIVAYVVLAVAEKVPVP